MNSWSNFGTSGEWRECERINSGVMSTLLFAAIMTEQATKKRFYVPALDGLRFVAFFLVMNYHMPDLPAGNGLVTDMARRVQTFGWIGVDLFFVLSAYLLARIYLIERERTGGVAVGQFFVRRVLRIWPLYFFVVLVAFTILPATGIKDFAPYGTDQFKILVAAHLGPLLLFIDNLVLIVAGFPPSHGVSVLWSLNVEEQFYLAFLPLLALLWGRSIKTVAIMIGAALSYCLVFKLMLTLGGAPYTMYYVTPIGRGEAFLVGILLGVLGHRGQLAKLPSGWTSLVGLVMVGQIMLGPDIFDNSPWIALTYPIMVAGFGLIIADLAQKNVGRGGRWLSAQPFVYLGRISYGLYCFHTIALVFVENGPLFNHSWGVRVGAIFAITVAAATLSFYLIERPFLRLKLHFSVIPSRPV